MRSRTALPLFLLVGSLAAITLSCERCQAGINREAEAITHAVPRTGISVEIKLLRGQIELYRRLHEGENPPSLEAMDTLPHLKYASEYSYDPNTGVVTSASYPGL